MYLIRYMTLLKEKDFSFQKNYLNHHYKPKEHAYLTSLIVEDGSLSFQQIKLIVYTEEFQNKSARAWCGIKRTAVWRLNPFLKTCFILLYFNFKTSTIVLKNSKNITTNSLSLRLPFANACFECINLENEKS